jgi:hypothetical protein
VIRPDPVRFLFVLARDNWRRNSGQDMPTTALINPPTLLSTERKQQNETQKFVCLVVNLLLNERLFQCAEDNAFGARKQPGQRSADNVLNDRSDLRAAPLRRPSLP